MSAGLKNSNSISIGPCELRIGDYTSNVLQVLPVLTASNNFGYSEVTNIVYSVDTKTRRNVDSFLIGAAFSNTIACSIESQTVEFSKDIIQLLFGIMPDSNAYINLGVVTDIDLRLELVYTYPDTTKGLSFVFPKVRINKGLNVSLTGDAEASPSLNFTVLEETSAAWAGKPYGIIYSTGF
jgi:hypothetical protein